jgi:DNA polymerase
MKLMNYEWDVAPSKKLAKLPSMYSPDQVFMVYDYETFSELNLKHCGSWEYSVHPSTEVLCVSWMVGTRKQLERQLKNRVKAQSWAPKRSWNAHRKDIRKGRTFAGLLKDKTIIKVAHNSMFEQAITRNVLPKHLGKYIGKAPFIIPHEQFLCTAVQSASHALPRSLDGVTGALKLKHSKDKDGHRLMLKWSKPKKPSKADPSTRYTKDFDRLLKYCEHDIYAEVGTFTKLDLPTPSERTLWLFDQVINFRGVRVDRDLVQKTLKLIGEEKKLLTDELRRLTKGFVKTSGQKKVLHAWLKKKGVELPNLQGKTVEAAIKDGTVEGVAKSVLLICQKLNKTSLKKYTAFLHHSASDGRIRFSLNFNATVHGRWGGAGVQPHNFPRGTLKYKDVEGKEHDLAPYAAELIKSGAGLEVIRMLFGDPTEVFVSCLRTMIVPSEGCELFVSDFSAIEARVLFWLADHKEGIKAFNEKRKMYEELAMVIFNRTSISGVMKDERFVGKQAFLGSGYGMGWPKFQRTCEDFGQPVSKEVAKKAINGYRTLHAPVVKLWNNLERAAIKAVQNPGKTFKVNKTEWFMQNKFLVCRLPSGRCLYYYGAEVKDQRTPWGESKPVLHHWTVDSKTKKWVFTKTWGGVLTQNCVGGISRDLLAASMVRQEKAGYRVNLTVHDESVCEREKNKGNLLEFNRLMQAVPKWAEGVPMAVEGFMGDRYRK